MDWDFLLKTHAGSIEQALMVVKSPQNGVLQEEMVSCYGGVLLLQSFFRKIFSIKKKLQKHGFDM